MQIKFILFCHLQDFATVTSGKLQSKAESEGTTFFWNHQILWHFFVYNHNNFHFFMLFLVFFPLDEDVYCLASSAGLHQQTDMRPTENVRHCLAFWIHKIKLSHIPRYTCLSANMLWSWWNWYALLIESELPAIHIKHPMDLRALGRVMSAMGYVSKRLGKTRARGFLVIENQVNSSTALALAQKIRAQEMADKADKGQEVF